MFCGANVQCKKTGNFHWIELNKYIQWKYQSQTKYSICFRIIFFDKNLIRMWKLEMQTNWICTTNTVK